MERSRELARKRDCTPVSSLVPFDSKGLISLTSLRPFLLLTNREPNHHDDCCWRECKQVCHKCAVRFDPMCANSRLFNTSAKRFRAGLAVGKLLIPNSAKTRRAMLDSPTLNQRFSVLPVPIASFGRRANTGPLRIPSRYFQGLTVPPVPPKVFKVRSIVRSTPTLRQLIYNQ